jgi:hypothetical protein
MEEAMVSHNGLRKALAGGALAVCWLAGADAAAQARRQISINGVWQSPAQIQQAERAAGVRLPNGHYWYDASSGLWGQRGGPPLGRIQGAQRGAGGRYAGGDIGSDGRCSYFNSPTGSVMTGDC